MNYLVINLKNGQLMDITKFENRSLAYAAHDRVALEPGVRSYLVNILGDRFGGEPGAPMTLEEATQVGLKLAEAKAGPSEVASTADVTAFVEAVQPKVRGRR